MNPLVNTISGRLSLRPPQREALARLARVVEVAPPAKAADPVAALEVIGSEFPSVTSFERDFPSLCFALATGVGKTRLMGAFIAYLHRERGIRHFLVLAPNLTIYDKLIRDFTPNTPKYVFQGLGEFASNPPEIITGENYEGGRGIRQADLFGSVHVNIFNISKMNAEVRGGKAPRIKRLSECIGRSYFEYLAGLDDLVLIMDESHRYRADAGVRVLNELRPILGLELTATPQIERGGRAERFRNIIYEYRLVRVPAGRGDPGRLREGARRLHPGRLRPRGRRRGGARAHQAGGRGHPAPQYVVNVTRGFIHLEGADFTLPAGETIGDFRVAPEAAREINSLLFGKFGRCTYMAQCFNSTPEWRFAGILETDPEVLKWVKPAPGKFQIFYRGDHPYEPDFVIETKSEKLLCEVKAARDMEDADVREKTLAAVQWCRHATDHERRHGGKPWRYLLIPHDAVEANRTLAGLAAQFEVRDQR